MKPSKEMLMASMTSRKAAEFSSARDWGGMPRFSADCSTLRPCSSVPVRKKTSRPRLRWKRAYTSATVEVYT